jgi:hypothetical protein
MIQEITKDKEVGSSSTKKGSERRRGGLHNYWVFAIVGCFLFLVFFIKGARGSERERERNGERERTWYL